MKWLELLRRKSGKKRRNELDCKTRQYVYLTSRYLSKDTKMTTLLRSYSGICFYSQKLNPYKGTLLDDLITFLVESFDDTTDSYFDHFLFDLGPLYYICFFMLSSASLQLWLALNPTELISFFLELGARKVCVCVWSPPLFFDSKSYISNIGKKNRKRENIMVRE